MKISLFLSLFLCGCAGLNSTTTFTQGTNGLQLVQTKVKAYTFFDSTSELTKFSNRGMLTQSNQWAPGTTIGQLNTTATSTNLDQIIGIIVQSAVQGAAKSAMAQQKPQP